MDGNIWIPTQFAYLAVQGACGKPTTLTLIQGTVIYYMILHATMA